MNHNNLPLTGLRPIYVTFSGWHHYLLEIRPILKDAETILLQKGALTISSTPGHSFQAAELEMLWHMPGFLTHAMAQVLTVMCEKQFSEESIMLAEMAEKCPMCPTLGSASSGPHPQ